MLAVNETFRWLLAVVKRETRRAGGVIQRVYRRRKEASGHSEGNGTSPDVVDVDGNSAPSLLRYNETTRIHPTAKDERETTVPIIKEDDVAPSTPSVEVHSATPLSQKDKTVERVRSSSEDIKTSLLRHDENLVDSYPPQQDNRTTSSQGVVSALPPESIEDDSACEHKFY